MSLSAYKVHQYPSALTTHRIDYSPNPLVNITLPLDLIINKVYFPVKLGRLPVHHLIRSFHEIQPFKKFNHPGFLFSIGTTTIAEVLRGGLGVFLPHQ